MNEPIISPWLIYLAGTAGGIAFLLFLCGVLSAFASFFVIQCKLSVYNPQPLGYLKCLPIIPAFLFILCAAVPDKDTIYQIAIAKMTTPSNINKILETGKSIKDGLKTDLIDVIKSFKDKPTEK